MVTGAGWYDDVVEDAHAVDRMSRVSRGRSAGNVGASATLWHPAGEDRMRSTGRVSPNGSWAVIARSVQEKSAQFEAVRPSGDPIESYGLVLQTGDHDGHVQRRELDSSEDSSAAVVSGLVVLDCRYSTSRIAPHTSRASPERPRTPFGQRARRLSWRGCSPRTWLVAKRASSASVPSTHAGGPQRRLL